MKQKIIFFFLFSFSTLLFSQTSKEKDLTFKVKSEKSIVKILPDKSLLYLGENLPIIIRIKPKGRKIGKVTFKGGKVQGQDSSYIITAGSGTEGILSVYEKTNDGNKLLINKFYEFKKVTLKASCVGVKNDSVIDLLTLEALGKITARIEETKKAVKVINFQMIVSSSEKTDTLNSKGSVLTKEMKTEIGKLKSGSAVYFYNIECQMPDMVIRKIQSLRLFISESKVWQIGM